ncbi:MAG: hypothetical protein MJZ68_06470, partial [archaeon]|nr:hypothetical protein [archaeon]
MFASRTKQTGLLAVLMVALMVFTAFVPMVNASAGSDIPPESDGSVLVPPFEDEGDTPTQADISGYTLAELLELYDVDSKLRGYLEGTVFESLIDYIDLYGILENLGLSDVTVGELSDGEKIKEILSGLDVNKILDILNVNTFLAENSLADVLEKFVDIDAVLENLGITSVTKEDVLTYLERFSLYDLVYDFGLDTLLTAIGLDKYVPGTIEILTKDRFKYTLDYFETDLGESTLTITNLSIDIDATQGWDSATTVVKVDSVGLSGEAYQASVESVLLDSGSEVTSFSVEKFTVISDGSSLVIDGILNGISVDNGVFTFMRVGDISVYDGEDKVFGLLPVKSSLYLAPFGPAALDDGDEEDVGPLAEFTLAFEGFEFGTVSMKDVEFGMAITDAPSPLIDFKVGEIKVGDLVTVKGFEYNSASDDKVTVSSLTLLGLPISLDRAFTEKGVTYDFDGLQIEIDGEIYSMDVLISTSGKDGVKNFHVEISSVTNIETKVCILDSFVFDMKSGSDLVVFAEVNGLEFDDTKVDHFKATFSDVDGKRSFDLEYTDVVFTVGSVKFELTPTSLSFSAPEYGMCGSISDDDGVYEIRVGLGSGNLDDCNVRFMTSSSGFIELLINELAVGDLVLDEATLLWDDNKFSLAFEKLVSEYVSISKFAIGKGEIFKALVESVEVGDEFVAEDVLFVAAESVSFTSAYFRIRDVEIDDFRVGSSEGKMILHVGSVLRGPEDARTIDIEGLEITSEPSFVCDVFIVNDDDVKVSITKSAVDVTLFGVSVHYGFEDGSFTVSGDLEFEGFSIKDISVTRYVDVQIEFTFVSETISFEVDITIGSGAVQIGVANVDYTGGSVTLNIDSIMFKLGDEDGFVVGLIVGDVKYTSVDGYYTTTVTIDNRDSLCSGISYHSGADGKDLRVGFGYLTYSVSVMGSSSSVYYSSFTAIIGTAGIQFTLFGLDDSGFEVMYVSKEKFTLTGTSETLGFGIERDGTRISASVFTYTVVESEKVLDKHLEIKVEDGSLSYLCIDVFIGGTIVRADLNDGVLEIGCINGESELDAHFKNGDMFTVDIAAHIPAMEFECSVGIAIVKDFASNSEGAVAVEILISIYDSSVHFTYDNGKFDIVANYGEEARLKAVYDGTLTVIIIISPAMFEGEIDVAFEDGVFTVSTESFGRETEGRAFLVTDATASFDGKTFKDTIGSYTHVIDGENYGIAIELENYCIEISSDVFNESVDVCSIVFGYEDVTVECDLDTLCIATDRLVLEAVLGDDIVATLSIDGDKVLDAVVGKDKFSVVGHYESDDYYLDADLNLVDGAYAGHMEFSSEIAEIEMVVEDGAIIFDDTVVTPFGILKDNGKIVDNVLVEYTVGFACIDNHIVLSYQKDGPKTTDIDWTFSNGVKVVQELSVAPAGGQGATTVTYGDLVLNGRSMFTTQLDTMEIEIDQGENCAVFTYQNDGPKTTDIDWTFSNGVKVVQEFSIAPVGGQGSTTVTYGEASCHTETVFTEQLDSMVVAVVYGDNHVKLAYVRDGEKTSDIDWTFSNGLSLRSNVTIGTDSGCGETNVVAGELSIHTETTYSEGVYTHASSFVRGSDHAVVNYRTGGDNSADIDWTFSNGIHLVQDMRNSPSGGQGSTTVTYGDFVLNSRSTFTTQLDTLNVEVTYGENDVSVEYAEGACCAQVTIGDLEVYVEVLSTDGKVSSVQIEITKGNVGAIAKVNETERVVAFAYNAEGQSFLVLFGKSDGKYMFEVEYADTVNRGIVSVFGETFLVDVDFTYGDFSVTAVAGNKDTFTMDVAISDKAFTLSASASEGKIELTSAFVYNERSLGVGLVYDGSIESMEFMFLGTDNHAIATYSKGVYSADVLFTYGTFNIEVAASGKDGSVDALAIIGYMGRTVTAGVVYADG